MLKTTPLQAILTLSLALSSVAGAQSFCTPGSAMDSALGVQVYPSCRTAPAPRPLGTLRLVRYPEVLMAAGIGLEDATLLLKIDSLGHLVPEATIAASRHHPTWAAALRASSRRWQFAPGVVAGRPVAVWDSVIYSPPLPPRPFVPRDCVDCDRELERARRLVVDARLEALACASALELIGRVEGSDSLPWAYRQVIDCPGAGAAAVLLIRKAERARTQPGLSATLNRIAASVHDTVVYDAALAAARRGHRFAFRILAYQMTEGWARVADSVRTPWDAQRGRPKGGCGPLRVVGRGRSQPPLEAQVDLRRYLAALVVADSLIAAPETSDDLRSTAWCLRSNHM
jgi:hypothetical protein